MTSPLTVAIPNCPATYDITFDDTLNSWQQRLQAFVGDRTAFWLTDNNVHQALWKSAGLPPADFIIPAGETSKNRETLWQVLDVMAEKKLDRTAVVICVGGGVVSDLGGLAASLYLRGIAVVHAPTSLLAMVDATVGGKTGIDTPKGKNLIGTFYQPQAIMVCRESLNTLPQDEVRHGLAEMIKHGFMLSADHVKALAALDQNDLDGIFAKVPDSIRLKKAVVEADEKESHQRMLLNFGHTFGHAVEHLSNLEIPHGQAVAIGMVAETNLAIQRGMATPETQKQLEEILSHFGLPTRCPYDEKSLWKALQTDKKVRGNKITFALAQEVGKGTLVEWDRE